jgi:hypothetical protein
MHVAQPKPLSLTEAFETGSHSSGRARAGFLHHAVRPVWLRGLGAISTAIDTVLLDC